MPTLVDEDGRPAAKDEATAALKQESTTTTAPASSSTRVGSSTKSSGKRARGSGGTTSTTTSSPDAGESVTIIHNANQQAIAAANLAAAVQMAASLQMNGLLSLLTQSSSTQGSAVVASAADPTLLGIQTNLPTVATSSGSTAAATSADSVSGVTSGGGGSGKGSKGGGDNPQSLSSGGVGGGVISSSGMNNWQIPTIEQVRQAATKMASDIPPFVHLSKTDSAPQLKILDQDRLTLKGGMRGYRMSRATHGVSQGYYYYEVLVLDPPTIHEIVNSLPPNARLGATLQKQIQTALEYDKKQKQQHRQQQLSNNNNNISSATTSGATKKEEETMPTKTEGQEGRKRKAVDESLQQQQQNKQQRTATPVQVGGHLRIGWSMRTGDLQAPVGYDKWSYGFRNIAGSKIHQSRREDNWGGEGWGPGDVIGCAIVLNNNTNSTHSSSKATATSATTATTKTTTTTSGTTTNTTGTTTNSGMSSSSSAANDNNKMKTGNQIRFFKNGSPMGHFVVTKGKREGGAAFDDIQPGTYYPAISSYLGGSLQVNFGPYFVYPPRKLPHGLSAGKLQPISSLQRPPLSQPELLSRLKQKKNIFSKLGKETPDTKMNAFREAVLAESMVLQEAYDQHRRKHFRQVLEARKSRNLNIADLQQELEELEGTNKTRNDENMDVDEEKREEYGGAEKKEKVDAAEGNGEKEKEGSMMEGSK